MLVLVDVDRIENEDVVVVFGQSDDVTLRRDLQTTASRHLKHKKGIPDVIGN